MQAGVSRKEFTVLQWALQGLAGIVAFAVLYAVGRIVLRRGGGDDSKDVGLD